MVLFLLSLGFYAYTTIQNNNQFFKGKIKLINLKNDLFKEDYNKLVELNTRILKEQYDITLIKNSSFGFPHFVTNPILYSI